MSEVVTYRGPTRKDGELVERSPARSFRLRSSGVVLRKDVPAELDDEQAAALRKVEGHKFDFGEPAKAGAATTRGGTQGDEGAADSESGAPSSTSEPSAGEQAAAEAAATTRRGKR